MSSRVWQKKGQYMAYQRGKVRIAKTITYKIPYSYNVEMRVIQFEIIIERAKMNGHNPGHLEDIVKNERRGKPVWCIHRMNIDRHFLDESIRKICAIYHYTPHQSILNTLMRLCPPHLAPDGIYDPI